MWMYAGGKGRRVQPRIERSGSEVKDVSKGGLPAAMNTPVEYRIASEPYSFCCDHKQSPSRGNTLENDGPL